MCFSLLRGTASTGNGCRDSTLYSRRICPAKSCTLGIAISESCCSPKRTFFRAKDGPACGGVCLSRAWKKLVIEKTLIRFRSSLDYRDLSIFIKGLQVGANRQLLNPTHENIGLYSCLEFAVVIVRNKDYSLKDKKH